MGGWVEGGLLIRDEKRRTVEKTDGWTEGLEKLGSI